MHTVLLRLLGIFVELARIPDPALNRRHVRRVDILLRQSLPRDFREPSVIHHVLAPTVQVPQPFGQIGGDELVKQVLGVRVDVRRVFDATFEDVFVDFHRGAAVPEGGKTAEHLEDEDAKRPPLTDKHTPGDVHQKTAQKLTSQRTCCSL